jgi:hypothetical protein
VKPARWRRRRMRDMVERPEERLVPTASSSSESEEWEGSGRRSSAEGGGRRRLRWPGRDQAESHG